MKEESKEGRQAKKEIWTNGKRRRNEIGKEGGHKKGRK